MDQDGSVLLDRQSRLDMNDRSEGAGFRRFASDAAARRAWNSVRAGLSEVR
jgi:hypothetical protein